MLATLGPDWLLRALILALPVSVLLVLVFIAVARKRLEPGGGAVEAKGKTQPNPTAPNPAPAPTINPDTQETETVQTLLSLSDAPPRHIEDRIKAAEARNDTRTLAELYLALARARQRAGQLREAHEALRSAAGVAALHGPKGLHAEARLELAAAALAAGDPTTACEHWQIARMALHEDGQKSASARVDKLMRDNGCPTDWVLTDF